MRAWGLLRGCAQHCDWRGQVTGTGMRAEACCAGVPNAVTGAGK